MKTFINPKIKRTRWESGPWDNEPDKTHHKDEATGYNVLTVRHPESGHWCGYVGVTEEHPLYQANYMYIDVSVHGGLTFAEACSPGEDECAGVCHVPEPGESDHVWWFGFDCHHHMDMAPNDKLHGYSYGLSHGSQYRTHDYVLEECRLLAWQLAQITDAPVMEDDD